MKPIIVLTDFSKTAEYAVVAAVQTARRYGAKLYVVHAVGSLSELNDVDASLKLLEYTRNPLFSGVEGEHKIIEVKKLGDLDKAVNELDGGLVFIGSRGRNSTRDLFFGSTTERAVTYITVPVIIVKNKVGDFKLDEVVFASNFYVEMEEGFSRFMKVISELGTKVHLLKIITKEHFEKSTVTYQGMDDFAKSVELENYTKNIYNHDEIDEGIIEFIRHIDVDALVLGVKAKKGISRVLFGDDLNNITEHVKRPVISVLVPEHRKTTRILFPE